MAITASNPVTVTPPATPPVFDEWRQVRKTEQWLSPGEPLSAFIVLRRCRRVPLLVDGVQPTDPFTGQPATTLIDMTADEEARVRQSDPTFSRDATVGVPDVFAMAGDPDTPEAVRNLALSLYAAQISLIVGYGTWKGIL